MRKGGAAVVLQQAEHRICVDPIARAGQESAAIVAAQVVTKRGNRAGVIKNVRA